jgi:hypothetical protein
MKEANETESMKAGQIPPVFPLHALQMLTNCDLSCAQQKNLALLELDYWESCIDAQKTFIARIRETLTDLRSKP